MEQKPFHSSRRHFLQISSLLAIGIVTNPIARALTTTDTQEAAYSSRFNNRVNQDEIRSLDFDSHHFPLRNYRLKSGPIPMTPSLF
ncbi:hypothetical protein B9T19_09720 [Ignatzschineria sp. F8392]|uniref:hypothetical protein n=1 Tax=Ignatzschineria sp. F8392 TaxID=1980117 RepID=UPI000B97E2BF|nr:hypothetical protein [Ignatzschineria sp. F8392]OYQ77584.1 hypothetical protein B9T19_09720 [Ignatzschineria sp. F8392]